MVKSGPKTPSEYLADGVRVPGQREPAPRDLEPGAVVFWDAIVTRLPVDFFTSETVPLLKAYCRHSHFADMFAQEITAQRDKVLQLESKQSNRNLVKLLAQARDHLINLHKMHGYETDHAASTATKLRITNQARFVPEKAASKARSAQNTGVPRWREWPTRPKGELNQ